MREADSLTGDVNKRMFNLECRFASASSNALRYFLVSSFLCKAIRLGRGKIANVMAGFRCIDSTAPTTPIEAFIYCTIRHSQL